jgi:Tfp pilus assembly protein PilF
MLDRGIAFFQGLVEEVPDDTASRKGLARALIFKGNLGLSIGAPHEAEEAFSAAAKEYQRALGYDGGADLLNEFAWFLARCRCAVIKNPTRAVALAKQALAQEPGQAKYWNTLGAAQFAAGDSRAAAVSLHRSMDLNHGGNPMDWFLLAMARWQENDRTEARAWFNKSEKWMETNTLMSDDLFIVREQAAAMLSRKDSEPRTKN